MKIRRNCKEVTSLVLQSHDRPLSRLERVSLRLHWLVCDGCRRFRGQARLMQQAIPRWRADRESGD
jgi:hypothetical protein